MGKRTKILVLGLLLLPVVIYGIHIPEKRPTFNFPANPPLPAVRPDANDDDLTPAPPGTGPDGLYATWAAVYFEGLGKQVSGRREAGMRLTFTQDKVVWTFDTPQGKKVYDGVYHIEPDRTPKEINLGEPDQPVPEKVIRGLYKIEGAKLTISGGAERP